MRHDWPTAIIGLGWRLLLARRLGGLGTPARGTEIVLKDGRVLRGKLGKVASLAESPQANQPDRRRRCN